MKITKNAGKKALSLTVKKTKYQDEELKRLSEEQLKLKNNINLYRFWKAFWTMKEQKTSQEKYLQNYIQKRRKGTCTS